MVRKLKNYEGVKWLQYAGEIALKSLCLRRRCGVVIINKNEEIIGIGFNSPPNNQKIEICIKDEIKEQIIEGIKRGENPKLINATCCVHAEERAVINALRRDNTKDLFKGASIYFAALDENDKINPSGRPWCIRCSTLILDVGIEKWCLWHSKGVWPQGEGIYEYSAKEYNEISFQYHKKGKKEVKNRS